MKHIYFILLIVINFNCKSQSKLNNSANSNQTVKHCSEFSSKISPEFILDWTRDSIGDLGLRNNYLIELDSSLVGLPYECVEHYLGKANYTMGLEYVYYCGRGVGTNEQLWIYVEKGIVKIVSYTIE